MSGHLSHPICMIFQKLMLDYNLGTSPDESPLLAWPIYYSSEPAEPDEVLTVYDTQSRREGRLMGDGEIREMYGIQIRIRASGFVSGNTKAQHICDAMDTGVDRDLVSVADLSGTGTTEYLIHTVARQGRPIHLGRRPPIDRLELFVINCFVLITEP